MRLPYGYRHRSVTTVDAVGRVARSAQSDDVLLSVLSADSPSLPASAAAQLLSPIPAASSAPAPALQLYPPQAASPRRHRDRSAADLLSLSRAADPLACQPAHAFNVARTFDGHFAAARAAVAAAGAEEGWHDGPRKEAALLLGLPHVLTLRARHGCKAPGFEGWPERDPVRGSGRTAEEIAATRRADDVTAAVLAELFPRSRPRPSPPPGPDPFQLAKRKAARLDSIRQRTQVAEDTASSLDAAMKAQRAEIAAAAAAAASPVPPGAAGYLLTRRQLAVEGTVAALVPSAATRQPADARSPASHQPEVQLPHARSRRPSRSPVLHDGEVAEWEAADREPSPPTADADADPDAADRAAAEVQGGASVLAMEYSGPPAPDPRRPHSAAGSGRQRAAAPPPHHDAAGGIDFQPEEYRHRLRQEPGSRPRTWSRPATAASAPLPQQRVSDGGVVVLRIGPEVGSAVPGAQREADPTTAAVPAETSPASAPPSPVGAPPSPAAAPAPPAGTQPPPRSPSPKSSPTPGAVAAMIGPGVFGPQDTGIAVSKLPAARPHSCKVGNNAGFRGTEPPPQPVPEPVRFPSGLMRASPKQAAGGEASPPPTRSDSPPQPRQSQPGRARDGSGWSARSPPKKRGSKTAGAAPSQPPPPPTPKGHRVRRAAVAAGALVVAASSRPRVPAAVILPTSAALLSPRQPAPAQPASPSRTGPSFGDAGPWAAEPAGSDLTTTRSPTCSDRGQSFRSAKDVQRVVAEAGGMRVRKPSVRALTLLRDARGSFKMPKGRTSPKAKGSPARGRRELLEAAAAALVAAKAPPEPVAVCVLAAAVYADTRRRMHRVTLKLPQPTQAEEEEPQPQPQVAPEPDWPPLPGLRSPPPEAKLPPPVLDNDGTSVGALLLSTSFPSRQGTEPCVDRVSPVTPVEVPVVQRGEPVTPEPGSLFGSEGSSEPRRRPVSVVSTPRPQSLGEMVTWNTDRVDLEASSPPAPARRASAGVGGRRRVTLADQAVKVNSMLRLLRCNSMPAATASLKTEAAQRPVDGDIRGQRGRLRAVVAAVGIYDDKRLLPCHQAVGDAQDLSEVLRHAGYKVAELHDSAEPPTAANIVAAVNRARAQCPYSADVCLFVFIGLGHWTAGLASRGKGVVHSDDLPEPDLHLFAKDFSPARAEEGKGVIRCLTDLCNPTFDEKRPMGLPVVMCDTVSCFGALRRRPQMPGPTGGCVYIGGRKEGVGGQLFCRTKARQSFLATYYVRKALSGHALRDSRITANGVIVYVDKKLRRFGLSPQTTALSLQVGGLGDVRLIERYELLRDRRAIRAHKEQQKASPAKIILGSLVSRQKFDVNSSGFNLALDRLVAKVCKVRRRSAAAAAADTPPASPRRGSTATVPGRRVSIRSPTASARSDSASPPSPVRTQSFRRRSAATAGESAPLLRQVYPYRAVVLQLSEVDADEVVLDHRRGRAGLQRTKEAQKGVVAAVREASGDPDASVVFFMRTGGVVAQVHTQHGWALQSFYAALHQEPQREAARKERTWSHDPFFVPQLIPVLPDADEDQMISPLAKFAAAPPARSLSVSVKHAEHNHQRPSAANLRRRSHRASHAGLVFGQSPASSPRRRSHARIATQHQQQEAEQKPGEPLPLRTTPLGGFKVLDAQEYVDLTLSGTEWHYKKLDRAFRSGELSDVLTPFSLRVVRLSTKELLIEASAVRVQAATRGFVFRRKWRRLRNFLLSERAGRDGVAGEWSSIASDMVEAVHRGCIGVFMAGEAALRADKELWEREERGFICDRALRQTLALHSLFAGQIGTWEEIARSAAHEHISRFQLKHREGVAWRFIPKYMKLLNEYHFTRDKLDKQAHLMLTGHHFYMQGAKGAPPQ